MEERGEAIVLIGFMGAGKSSIGRALAHRTGLPLFDTDELVARRLEMPITEIFARHGEAAFRNAETTELCALRPQPAVVVTGGGIVLRPENVSALRRLGVVVHLTADEATLFERATRRATRPLLQTENPRARFAELLAARSALYVAAADVTLDTSGLRRDEVVDAVLSELAKLEGRAA
jgi:shikimate kinase